MQERATGLRRLQLLESQLLRTLLAAPPGAKWLGHYIPVPHRTSADLWHDSGCVRGVSTLAVSLEVHELVDQGLTVVQDDGEPCLTLWQRGTPLHGFHIAEVLFHLTHEEAVQLFGGVAGRDDDIERITVFLACADT